MCDRKQCQVLMVLYAQKLMKKKLLTLANWKLQIPSGYMCLEAIFLQQQGSVFSSSYTTKTISIYKLLE